MQQNISFPRRLSSLPSLLPLYISLSLVGSKAHGFVVLGVGFDIREAPLRRRRRIREMKIQCDVCERAEAALLCCADEAALCWGCDEKVHAANKLAGKHQRVPLLSNSSNPSSKSSPNPTCDICQEKTGYFFCLEDRALLCRHCDVSIHSASPYVSSHQRFLITGVRVALQHYLTNNSNNISSSSNNHSNSSNNTSSNSNGNNIPSHSLASNGSPANKKLRISPADIAVEEAEGLRSQWPWNEILETNAFDQCYGFPEPGASS
ncbi:hypothetical protein J5N97_020876 [Dioscorea zingiberensis]|uniref:B box-type domain-containing protein n=1 Tax=Dioscorea zingiberensis TaxID=325984 RepID=A0A9D5HE71_9LILI|nr:hypothetical protein J5N97_020876 [Dioscorea zingiberensis]